MFKTCPNCDHPWPDRDGFLSDPALSLVGYQPNYGELTAGFFLFAHDVPECGTSLAIEAGEFTDMHKGPIFEDRLKGTDKCPGLCLHESNLNPCPEKCECCYVRDVLQTVKDWPKREKQPAIG